MKLEQIAVSPCSNPRMALDDVLAAYSAIGYRNFEAFTQWTVSAFDYHREPGFYIAKGKRFGMAVTSLHLPEIRADQADYTLREALAAARFADAVGVEVVLYKASDRPTYVAMAEQFLNAVDRLSVTPVIQNHYGTALTTLEDVREVRAGIADRRMHTLLEVGHFHKAGVHWRAAAEALGDSIALVHVKDQVGLRSVPFGQGEIDLPGLFSYMDRQDYAGRYVVEMEVRDEENTLTYLADAYHYVKQYCEEAG